MKAKNLAILFLRLMSVYIGLSGLQSLRYSHATIEILDFWQMIEMLGLMIFLPIAVGAVLWWFSPLVARKVFSDSESDQELSISVSGNNLLVIGIRLIAIVSILKGIPVFLGNSFALFQHSHADIGMSNQMKIWWVVGVLNFVIGGYLLLYTKHFLNLIDRGSGSQ